MYIDILTNIDQITNFLKNMESLFVNMRRKHFTGKVCVKKKFDEAIWNYSFHYILNIGGGMEELLYVPGSFDPITNGHIDIIKRGANF